LWGKAMGAKAKDEAVKKAVKKPAKRSPKKTAKKPPEKPADDQNKGKVTTIHKDQLDGIVATVSALTAKVETNKLDKMELKRELAELRALVSQGAGRVQIDEEKVKQVMTANQDIYRAMWKVLVKPRANGTKGQFAYILHDFISFVNKFMDDIKYERSGG